MVTTIQISNSLLDELQKMKVFVKESYEDVIWDLIEDRIELSEQTKKDLAEAKADIKAGRITSFEDIKKRYIKNVQN